MMKFALNATIVILCFLIAVAALLPGYWLVVSLFILMWVGYIGAASGVVFLLLLPLVLPIIVLFPSVRAKVMPYAIASLIGVSIATALCFLSADFSTRVSHQGLHIKLAGEALENYEMNHPDASHEKDQFRSKLVSLHKSGQILFMAGLFVEQFSSVLLPSLFLPPLVLYACKRTRASFVRKHKEGHSVA